MCITDSRKNAVKWNENVYRWHFGSLIRVDSFIECVWAINLTFELRAIRKLPKKKMHEKLICNIKHAIYYWSKCWKLEKGSTLPEQTRNSPHILCQKECKRRPTQQQKPQAIQTFSSSLHLWRGEPMNKQATWTKIATWHDIVGRTEMCW